MKKCPNCNADNPDKAYYCHACSHKLRHKVNGWKFFAIIVLVIALPIGIGISYYADLVLDEKRNAEEQKKQLEKKYNYVKEEAKSYEEQVKELKRQKRDAEKQVKSSETKKRNNNYKSSRKKPSTEPQETHSEVNNRGDNSGGCQIDVDITW